MSEWLLLTLLLVIAINLWIAFDKIEGIETRLEELEKKK